MKNNNNIIGWKFGLFLSFAFFLAVFLVYQHGATLQGAAIDGSVTAASTSSFDLNSLVLKASVKKGESVTKILTVSKGNGQKITIEIIGLKGVNASEQVFSLNEGTSKNLQVRFDSGIVSPGVYAGSIKVSDDKNTLFLPVIFEVESKDVFYDANLDIAPQYSTIYPGGKLVAQVKLFDLTSGGTANGLGRNSVILEYNVRNIKGDIISTETESIVVDKQTQVTKAITFPKNIDLGDYVFTVNVKYKSSIGVASYLFNINKESAGKAFNFSTGSLDINFIIIVVLVVVFFLGIVILFIYVVKDRDSIILELKKFNEEEFERQRRFILAQEKMLREKGNIKEVFITRQRKEKLAKLEKNFNERKKKLSELKKGGDEGQMERQLMDWKRQGYNTMGLEYKMHGLSEKEMRDVLGMWKKQYQYKGEGYKKRRK